MVHLAILETLEEMVCLEPQELRETEEFKGSLVLKEVLERL